MRRRLVLWALVIAGAAAFASLTVWLYTLIGYAVVIPLGVAAVAYLEIRLSGISEQLEDLLEAYAELKVPEPAEPCGAIPTSENVYSSPCSLELGHPGEWHRAKDGTMWRPLGNSGTEYRRG